MPKFPCLCGESINLSPVPAPDEYVILSEESLEQLLSHAIKGALEETLYDMADQYGKSVIICPKCGRWHVESSTDDNGYQSYIQENSK